MAAPASPCASQVSLGVGLVAQSGGVAVDARTTRLEFHGERDNGRDGDGDYMAGFHQQGPAWIFVEQGNDDGYLKYNY